MMVKVEGNILSIDSPPETLAVPLQVDEAKQPINVEH